MIYSIMKYIRVQLIYESGNIVLENLFFTPTLKS